MRMTQMVSGRLLIQPVLQHASPGIPSNAPRQGSWQMAGFLPASSHRGAPPLPAPCSLAVSSPLAFGVYARFNINAASAVAIIAWFLLCAPSVSAQDTVVLSRPCEIQSLFVKNDHGDCSVWPSRPIAEAVPLPVFAQAQETHPKDSVFRLGVGVMVVGHGADLWSTGKCIGAGTCREVNPALRWAQDTEVTFGAVKMAGAAFQVWLVEKVHRKHRTAGRITAFAIGGAMVAVAFRNGREAGKNRAR